MRKKERMVEISQPVIVILFATFAPLKLEVTMYSPGGNLIFNAA
jgi:hypothetical protein